VIKAPGTSLEVWFDADFLDAQERVGTLTHARGHVYFEYDAAWLKQPHSFTLDPSLTLDKTPFHPDPAQGNFGIFLDSAPDRWGQTLMNRREALEAKDEKRTPRTLHAWDFLIGVQDVTRQGALRFRLDGEARFLSDHTLPAPPVASLRELEAVARELTSKRIDNLDKLRRWLAVLVAPGASLGGARPKANFTDDDGSLWIAKFPARDDVHDVGGWEGVAHTLARKAKVDVPLARVLKLGSGGQTFCVQRFDRRAVRRVQRRVFYASAMTLLQKKSAEGTSYLELAEFIQKNGPNATAIEADLEQLFRRVVFNVAIGNRDDHLRNHGFLLGANGWRLAPAFDVNPNLYQAEHVMLLDEADKRPSIETVLETHAWYRLDDSAAGKIVSDVVKAARPWADVARRAGIAAADIEQFGPAFSALTDYVNPPRPRAASSPSAAASRTRARSGR
jgi:serine/threonine-protein kinase HipA